jgi:predicted CXXCH cytochrome family protein
MILLINNEENMNRLFGFIFILFVAPMQDGLCQSSPNCLMCHGNNTLSVNRNGRTVSLFVEAAQLKKSIHSSLNCQDCHAGQDVAEFPHMKPIKPVSCRGCHQIKGFDKNVHGISNANDPSSGCKGCHGTHTIRSVKDPESPINRNNVSARCGACHRDQYRQFAVSAHGVAFNAGDINAPSCVVCHDAHTVESSKNKATLVKKTEEVKLCFKCHLDNAVIQKQVGYSAAFIAGYTTSVHGLAAASGNPAAASCSDCHGLHDAKKASNPASGVNKWQIVNTCGRCHQRIAKEYGESIHGVARSKGKSDSPVCTDCHGEHQIFSAKDKRSTVSPLNVSVQVCAGCHSSVKLSGKYGLSSGQFATFSDSFHGLAAMSGNVAVANCASCHGYHNVRPSSDPASTVNKANLAATCGKCHPGANENFAKGLVHVDIKNSSDSWALYWIRNIYILLIIVVVGSMFLHNFLDFIRKTALRFAIRQGKIAPKHYRDRLYVRMTLNQRIQHVLMLVSFILLAVTGFMLKFPEAWWVFPIRQISERFFEVRSLVHRIAGVTMIAISIYHLFYIIFTRLGRRFLADIFPVFKDAGDLWANMLYLLGISKKRPLFDRFSYTEKAEYWALIWGVFLMSATGIIMWHDNYFIGLLTKLGWDISRTIHFYEAVLATLSIVVWHFYFVIFNPNIYPMNTTWITGKISEEEMAEEHPLELDKIKEE